MLYRLAMQSHDSRSSNCLLHDLSLAPHTVSDWQKIWQNPNYCPGLSIGLKIFTFEVNSWVWGYACNTNLIYNASSSHQELVWFHLLATLFGGSGALHLRWNQPGLEGLPCFGWTKAESSKCSTKSIIQLPRSATRCKWFGLEVENPLDLQTLMLVKMLRLARLARLIRTLRFAIFWSLACMVKTCVNLVNRLTIDSSIVIRHRSWKWISPISPALSRWAEAHGARGD